jgi:4-diphosphocytidyl-2-C-methyl-D-erythritol kinase
MRAPAKINLSLHVLGRRLDGYHDLESLVAFAGCTDLVSLDQQGELSLTQDGPQANQAGPIADNLILRAARQAQVHIPSLHLGAFHLTKRLPVGAGIGGGSSDAAAALRLIAKANGLDKNDPRLFEAAKSTGADVPVCLDPIARMMRGMGDDLSRPIHLPLLFAVLVNPNVHVDTGSIFKRLGFAPGEARQRNSHPLIEDHLSFDQLIAVLNKTANDLEDAASLAAPVIPHVLNVLMAAPGCRLARMSGSGSTCFALFAKRSEALRATKVLRHDHPDWWTRATLLR